MTTEVQTTSWQAGKSVGWRDDAESTAQHTYVLRPAQPQDDGRTQYSHEVLGWQALDLMAQATR